MIKKCEIVRVDNGFILKYSIEQSSDTPQWQDEWVEVRQRIFLIKEDLLSELNKILK